ncbi:hypothetical protein ACFW9U_17400 [Rhodococcus aetherivorans]|uniref:hypothetical protein n=1 Tax=Rhodococcus aetherivorans TaxID=191292 RepID=UPI00366BAC04
MTDYYDRILQDRYKAGAARSHDQQLEQGQQLQDRRAERQAQVAEQEATIDAIRAQKASGEPRSEVDRLRQARAARASEIVAQRQQAVDAELAARNAQGVEARRQLDAYAHSRGGATFTDRLAAGVERHQAETARRRARQDLLQGRGAGSAAADV